MIKNSFFVFGLIFFLLSWNAKSVENCPNLFEISSQVTTATETLKQVEDFVQKGNDGSVPLEVLFQVDLTNEDAVNAKRAQLIDQSNKVQVKDLKQTDAPAQCIEYFAESKRSTQLHQDIIKQKLAYFYLPQEERSSGKEMAEVDDMINFAKASLLETSTESQEKITDELEIGMAEISGTIATNEKRYLDYLKFFKTKKLNLDLIKVQARKNSELDNQDPLYNVQWRNSV